MDPEVEEVLVGLEVEGLLVGYGAQPCLNNSGAMLTTSEPMFLPEEWLAEERARVLAKSTELREILYAAVDPDVEDGAPEMAEQGRARALLGELEG